MVNYANSILSYYNLTAGAAGVGGNGADGEFGAQGSVGSNGQNGNTSCGNASGGNGGRGGNGDRGGRGQDGANGVSIDRLILGGGVSFSQLNAPTNDLSIIANSICALSEVRLAQSGSSTFSLFGNWSTVSDETNATSSFTLDSDTVKVYDIYIGSDQVFLGSQLYEGMLIVNGGDRVLPQLRATQTLPISAMSTSDFGSMSTLEVCAGATVAFDISNSSLVTPVSTDYEWTIIDLDNANAEILPLGGASGSSTTHSFANAGGNYQIRLRANSACCGWSLPIYGYKCF